MTAADKKSSAKDRKLGDEWLDWDGHTQPPSSEADRSLFLGFAVLSGVTLTGAAAAFLWLIYPRLAGLGGWLPELCAGVFLLFAGVVMFWVTLFTYSALSGRLVARFVVSPGIVNRLLSLVTWLGKVLHISTDRLTNSFMKVHNDLLGNVTRQVAAKRLMVLAPRCLTKDNNRWLRDLRDEYGFELVTVGGGSDARTKIRQIHPEVVLAIACERDLLSGFKEVNPHVPVIGFPNQRPEGPCKNTSLDRASLERTIQSYLHDDRLDPATATGGLSEDGTGRA
jgi:hypothetical protein